jgi:hypothetical protein
MFSHIIILPQGSSSWLLKIYSENRYLDSKDEVFIFPYAI